MKKRLDQLLVERGLVSSRERAKAIILSGNVLVNDEPQSKAGQLFKDDVSIRLREPDHPYVSRGALKLKAALESFKIDVGNRVAMDIGASTGGFTQILLENGILLVHAIDVGHNQLDWKIRSDQRVRVYEKNKCKSTTVLFNWGEGGHHCC
jgi:23S rRNA (cytidine1920-2'-O)/16S rRNA (cytidine1409-2'-O)-methyltransferase